MAQKKPTETAGGARCLPGGMTICQHYTTPNNSGQHLPPQAQAKLAQLVIQTGLSPSEILTALIMGADCQLIKVCRRLYLSTISWTVQHDA